MNIKQPHNTSASKHRTVLLVKACTNSRHSGGSTLFRDGWNVIEASSVEDALEYKEKKFDAVLADLEFKNGSASALTSTFQAPFLLFSNKEEQTGDTPGTNIRSFEPAQLNLQLCELLGS